MKGDSVVKIKLTNTVQQPILEGIRTELVQYLRGKLSHNQISLEAELIKLEEKDLIYTASEKFNFLVEKYPALKELKNALGLDTDH